jgi:anti-anti-sigma regulatory factor
MTVNSQNFPDEYGVVRLEGELTLANAEEIKTKFVRALADADAVMLRFGEVQDLDLSCLQLFCSLHRSAMHAKKSVCIDGKIPAALLEAAAAGGFSRLTGCKHDDEKHCLWAAVAGAQHG